MYTRTIVFFLLVFLFAPVAQAKDRPVFPDSTSLQPIPVNVKPNISGNINSSNEAIPVADYEEDFYFPTSEGQSSEEEIILNDVSAPNTEPLSIWVYIWGILATLGIIAVGVFIVVRHSNKASES